MVAPKHKSHSLRKVFKKTPGNRNVVHYEKRKPNKAVCTLCGKPLSGVARDLPSRIKNMPKSSKRPERPYGGVLCSSCMRRVIVEETRFESEISE
jgi:large subunit ribosomal protein L34e